MELEGSDSLQQCSAYELIRYGSDNWREVRRLDPGPGGRAFVGEAPSVVPRLEMRVHPIGSTEE